MSVVLMYHALYRGDDTSAIDAEDLPYAVAERHFAAQLDAIVARRETGAKASVAAGDEPPEVLVTFDDGHVSNHDIALPLLRERGLHAWFFVTSDFIGRRNGFCDERHIAALVAAGMTVGSHGTSHAFLDDLDDAAATRELVGSRERLAAITAAPIDSISFPGGRWNARTLELAERAGFRALFGSVLDTVRPDALGRGRREDGTPIPRVAIRRTTTLAEFGRIIDADAGYYRRHRTAQGVKRVARAVLGNRIYHGLYKSLS